MSRKFTFAKEEKLKSRKIIGSLFSGAESYSAYPVRVVWREIDKTESDFFVKTAFSVPKKRFKTAVERNLLKRRMREAYRLKKYKFYRKLEGSEKSLAVMLIYTGKQAVNYAEIEKSMGKIIWRLGKIADADWRDKSKKNKKL